MGLLDPADWKAQWIGYDEDRQPEQPETAVPAVRPAVKANPAPEGKPKRPAIVLPPAQYLRAQFRAEKSLARATFTPARWAWWICTSTAGASAKITSPPAGPTTPSASITAPTTSPTGPPGDNALGAVLADGWFSGYIGYRGNRDIYGKHPRVRAQLHLEYADGSTADIATGPDWKASHRPDPRGRLPQRRDLRRPPGTAPAGISRAATTPTGRRSRSAATKCIRWCRPIPARRCAPSRSSAPGTITEPKPGVYVLDLGQNFAGVAAPEGVAASPARRSRCASPSGSIPTAPSTPPTCAAPAPPTPTSAKATAPKPGSRASPSTASNTSRSPA